MVEDQDEAKLMTPRKKGWAAARPGTVRPTAGGCLPPEGHD